LNSQIVWNHSWQRKIQKQKKGNSASLGIENELWQAADKLHGHLNAADYMSMARKPTTE